MQEKIIWFWIQLKTCLKSPGFYLQLICMVAVVLLAGSISIPDGKNVNAGIYTPAGGYASEIIGNIQASESVFTFHIYDSREKLDSDVAAGRIECGFVFDEYFDEKFESGNIRKSIEYLCSPNTTKGAVIQESVYAAFLRSYSRIILKLADEQVFNNSDEARLQEMLEQNDEYIDSSYLFDTNLIKVDCVEYDDGDDETEAVAHDDSVKGIAGLMIFLIMYMYAGKNLTRRGNVKAALKRSDAAWFDFLGITASGIIPVFIMLVIICYIGFSDGMNGASRQSTGILCVAVLSAKLVGFILYSALWITCVTRLMKNRMSYYAGIIVIMVFFLMLCPVFVDLSQYLPAIRYIRILVPLSVLYL